MLVFVKHIPHWIIISSVFFLGLILGIILPVDVLTPKITLYSQEQRLPNSSYKFINPLLECDANSFSTDTELDHLKTQLQNYIQQQTDGQKITFASVYYRDLNNGPWFGINASELFSPSSLIKVPLMIAYLKEAQDNPTILDQVLTNNQKFEPNSVNIVPEVTLIPNQKYTVRELISRMIIYSDNLAYNLLNENMDAQKIIKVYNDFGIDISKGYTDPNGNIISVKSYASFFRILFNSSYLNQDMSEYALNLLSQTKFTQGLVAGLPTQTTVAHKFGERQYLDTGQKQLHDCGIVYLPENPYLICVMTRGQNFFTLEETIKNISSMVYGYITTH